MSESKAPGQNGQQISPGPAIFQVTPAGNVLIEMTPQELAIIAAGQDRQQAAYAAIAIEIVRAREQVDHERAVSARAQQVAQAQAVELQRLRGELAKAAPDVGKMVDRFLGWKLPDDFRPDAGIFFDPTVRPDWPTGTNLMDANQARQMIEHMLAEPKA